MNNNEPKLSLKTDKLIRSKMKEKFMDNIKDDVKKVKQIGMVSLVLLLVVISGAWFMFGENEKTASVKNQPKSESALEETANFEDEILDNIKFQQLQRIAQKEVALNDRITSLPERPQVERSQLFVLKRSGN